jgi:hypothetical protein
MKKAIYQDINIIILGLLKELYPYRKDNIQNGVHGFPQVYSISVIKKEVNKKLIR